MTEKMLARVAVSSVPYAADRLYTYLVPDELIGSAEVGKRVTIPFGRGNRRVEGFLLEVGREAATSPLKPIDAVLDDAPLLDAKDIRLVRWMKARYFCTYYDAIKTILPGGVWLQYRELWHVNGEISAEDALSSVAPDSLEETLLRAMLSAKEIERAALDELGGEKTAKALRSLEACGLAVRETKLRQRLQDKSVRMVSLCVSAEDALAAVETKRRSAPVRYAVVELLSREGCLSSSEISYYTGATMQTLRGLKKAGLVEFSEREVLRVSRYDDAPAREDIVLNGEQQAAFDGLCTLLGREGGSAALLHGVTASGKTQVYIRLIEEALTRGKTAMLLVPEIALTPQMLRRFTAQFGSDVAMLHSALPLTERYDQWKRIRRGEVRVVLGTRSAVFAPLQNLGLIILDEEQETSYQSENPPRYHARDVAKFRCAQHRALLEQVEALEDHADVLADGLAVAEPQPGEIDVVVPHVARIGFVQSDQRFEQHGLSRAAAADDEVRFSGLEFDRNVVEHHPAVERLDDMFGAYHISRTCVRIRSKSRITTQLATTARVEAVPTSSELPRAL